MAEEWDWEAWGSSPPRPVRLPVQTMGGLGWIVLLAGPLYGAAAVIGVLLAGPHAPLANRLSAGGSVITFAAAFTVVGFRYWHTLRQPSYLELLPEAAVLSAPAFFREPLTIPKAAMASVDVDTARWPARALGPSAPAAPILGLGFYARTNVLLLLASVIGAPELVNEGRRRWLGVADGKSWIRSGRPVAGVRLRLPDPETAAPLLGAWLPQASEPALAPPGSAVPGLVSASALARQQRRVIAAMGAAFALALAASPFTPRPASVAASVAWGALVSGVLWLGLRAAVRLHRPVAAAGAASAIVLAILVLIGFLQTWGPHWFLYGTIIGGVVAVVLVQFDAQRARRERTR